MQSVVGTSYWSIRRCRTGNIGGFALGVIVNRWQFSASVGEVPAAEARTKRRTPVGPSTAICEPLPTSWTTHTCTYARARTHVHTLNLESEMLSNDCREEAPQFVESDLLSLLHYLQQSCWPQQPLLQSHRGVRAERPGEKLQEMGASKYDGSFLSLHLTPGSSLRFFFCSFRPLTSGLGWTVGDFQLTHALTLSCIGGWVSTDSKIRFIIIKSIACRVVQLTLVGLVLMLQFSVCHFFPPLCRPWKHSLRRKSLELAGGLPTWPCVWFAAWKGTLRQMASHILLCFYLLDLP